MMGWRATCIPCGITLYEGPDEEEARIAAETHEEGAHPDNEIEWSKAKI